MRTHVWLNHQRWKVDTESKLKSVWGWCRYRDRLIQVCPSTRKNGKYREVLIHEMLHAALPFLSEKAVDSTAKKLDANLGKRYKPSARRHLLIRKVMKHHLHQIDFIDVKQAAEQLNIAMGELGI